MKIAQIAPLYESVPPKFYGGTERVVSYLTEELVRQGHEVTLFASGDSKTAAKLVRCSDMALRLNPIFLDPLPYHVIMLEEVRRRAEEFDVLHFHIDFLHGPLVRDFAGRTVTTLHGRLDLPHVVPFYHVFRELPLVAVSSDQRKYLRSANWIGTIHHGLPCDLLPFQPKVSGGYLAFLGRIAPEKTTRSSHRNRWENRNAAEDRGKGGPRRSGLLGRKNSPNGKSKRERRISR